MNNDRLFWLALNSVKGVGAVRFRALLDAFGSAEAAWRAAPAALRAAGMNESTVQNFVELHQTLDLELIEPDLAKYNIAALIWEDEAYPRKLRELDQAPPVLYVRGQLLPEDEWAVAVVGTRQVTAYGRQIAEEFGAFLAHNGITLVSGLARGVDAISHQAALRAGGRRGGGAGLAAGTGGPAGGGERGG